MKMLLLKTLVAELKVKQTETASVTQVTLVSNEYMNPCTPLWA